MPVLDPREVEEMVAAMLSSNDVAEIFATACRVVMARREFFLLKHSYDEKTARNRPIYGRTCGRMREILAGARQTASAGGHGELSNAHAQLIRIELTRRLQVVEDIDVFPVILGLLDAIDHEWGELIRKLFFACVASKPVVPLEASRAYPRPWSPLGIKEIQRRHRPPMRTETMDYLELEQYFAQLTVARPEHFEDPQPALHVDSQRILASSGNPGPWRVAIISYLADPEEIDWKTHDLSYRGEEFRSTTRESLVARFKWALSQSLEFEPDLILIPELNLDDDLVEELRRSWEGEPASKFQGWIFGGRLHVPAAGPAGLYRNEPVVLTPRGDLFWPYKKREPAGYKFPDGHYRREALLKEASPVVAIDMPLGRLAIVMCLDYLDSSVMQSLIALRANIIIVLSMCNCSTIALYEAKAAELASSNGAVTIVANSSVHHRGSDRGAAGPWPLGLVYPNTRTEPSEVVSHGLEDESACAVVGLYTIAFDYDRGLSVTREDRPYCPS